MFSDLNGCGGDLASSEPKSKIYLVDGCSMVSDFLCQHLAEAYELERYEQGSSFVDAYKGDSQGCIILAIEFPALDGFDILDFVYDQPFSNPIIVITDFSSVDIAVRALESGAYAFLQRPVNEAELLNRMESALRLDRQHRAEYPMVSEFRMNRKKLTRREDEVLLWVIEGYSTRDIAEKLEISDRTVETHRSNIMRKLQANSIGHLVSMAINSIKFSQHVPRRPWRANPPHTLKGSAANERIN